MPQVTSAKLTANPAAEGRAWVQLYELENEERLTERGRLYVVLSFNRSQAHTGTLVDSVLAGRDIIGKLQEEYFGNLTGGAFASLQRALENAVKNYAAPDVHLQIICAASLGNVVYVSVSGGGQVALLRNGMLVKILVGVPGKVAVASGYPVEGDKLLLSTREFGELFSEGEVRAALSQGSPRAAVEQLAPRLHAEEAPNVGCIVLGFGVQKEAVPAVIQFEQPKRADEPTPSTPFFRRVAGKIPLPFPPKSIYVHAGVDDAGQSRRTAYTVGVLLLAILAISIIFGIRQKRQNDYREQYAAQLATARHDFDEAQSLITLNPSRARELFTESARIAGELENQKIKDPALDELKQLLSSSEGKILGEYSANLDLFVDLSLISDGFSGKDLAASGDNIFVLDPSGKIMQVLLSTKRSEIVAGPEEAGGASQIAAYADRVFFVKGDGIYEAGKGIRVKKNWEGDALVYAYTGNLYVLEKGNSTIKRFSGGAGSFGSGTNWLGSGINIDLGNSIAWTINGSIWIASSTGKITQLTQGVPQSFAPDPLTPSLAPTALYTNEDLKGLYVLDAKNSRLVVFDKDGRLLALYKNDSLKDATDLVVSEEDKKAIVLTGSKLQSIQLRHLD